MNVKMLGWFVGGVLVGLFVYWVWAGHQQIYRALDHHAGRLNALESKQLPASTAQPPNSIQWWKWFPAAAVIAKLVSDLANHFWNHR